MEKPTTRFGLFLSAVLGTRKSGKPVSVQQLNKALNGLNAPEDARDNRKTIYGYIKGSHVPHAPQAWNIGVALNTCELQWCNGLVTLFHADHYSDFIGVVANVAPEPREKYRMLLSNLLSGLCASWFMFGDDRLRMYERVAEIYVPETADDDWLGRCGASLDEDAFATLSAALDDAWKIWRNTYTVPYYDLLLLAKSTKEDLIPNWQLQGHMAKALDVWLRREARREPNDFDF